MWLTVVLLLSSLAIWFKSIGYYQSNDLDMALFLQLVCMLISSLALVYERARKESRDKPLTQKEKIDRLYGRDTKKDNNSHH